MKVFSIILLAIMFSTMLACGVLLIIKKIIASKESKAEKEKEDKDKDNGQ